MELSQLTPEQLRKAAVLKERLTELEQELVSVLGALTTTTQSKTLHWTQTPEGAVGVPSASGGLSRR